MSNFVEVISISTVGEETGSIHNGSFKVKTLLSRRELLAADEMRRILLGANPESASRRQQADAFMYSQLAARIVEAPDWWKGADMDDVSPAEELFNKAIEAEAKRKENTIKTAEAALDKLRKKEQEKQEK